jgi:uncharacterized membrane protein YqaE (UPF0057 family)
VGIRLTLEIAVGRILLIFLAIFFPWIVLLVKDDPGGALVALLLQATIIGWLPATIWAIRVVRKKPNAKTDKQATKKEIQEK